MRSLSLPQSLTYPERFSPVADVVAAWQLAVLELRVRLQPELELESVTWAWQLTVLGIRVRLQPELGACDVCLTVCSP